MNDNYKAIDTQKIIDYINSFSDAIEVDSILRNSNADKLRVYPALFELEQSGFLEVVEREELGAQKKFVKRKLNKRQVTAVICFRCSRNCFFRRFRLFLFNMDKKRFCSNCRIFWPFC